MTPAALAVAHLHDDVARILAAHLATIRDALARSTTDEARAYYAAQADTAARWHDQHAARAQSEREPNA